MITGEDYSAVEKAFKENFDREGLKSDAAREYICDRNFSAVEKKPFGYSDVQTCNKRMAAPFAPAHMVDVLPYINAKHAHSVVMDAKGRVYDPQYPAVKDFSEYYCIIRVTGYFYGGTRKK